MKESGRFVIRADLQHGTQPRPEEVHQKRARSKRKLGGDSLYPPSDPHGNDIDARLLGRRPAFEGAEREWNHWVFVTRTYMETHRYFHPSDATKGTDWSVRDRSVMLHTRLRPATFPPDLRGIQTEVQDWDLPISKKETMAEDILNRAVKRQIVVGQSPPEIRTAVAVSRNRRPRELVEYYRRTAGEYANMDLFPLQQPAKTTRWTWAGSQPYGKKKKGKS